MIDLLLRVIGSGIMVAYYYYGILRGLLVRTGRVSRLSESLLLSKSIGARIGATSTTLDRNRRSRGMLNSLSEDNDVFLDILAPPRPSLPGPSLPPRPLMHRPPLPRFRFPMELVLFILLVLEE